MAPLHTQDIWATFPDDVAPNVNVSYIFTQEVVNECEPSCLTWERLHLFLQDKANSQKDCPLMSLAGALTDLSTLLQDETQCVACLSDQLCVKGGLCGDALCGMMKAFDDAIQDPYKAIPPPYWLDILGIRNSIYSDPVPFVSHSSLGTESQNM